MNKVIVKINNHFLDVTLGNFYKRVPTTWSEPEEPAHYDIEDVQLISDTSLDYDQIEKAVGVDDLWEQINYILLDDREKNLNEY
jgi:hypothetical protein